MKKTGAIITIKPLKINTMNVRIVGDSPLIMHKWSEKAKKEMLDAMTNKEIKAKGKARPAKDPVAEFIDSMYWMEYEPTEKTEEGFDEAIKAGAKFGFPATAIKQATISAAYRSGKTKDMASLRGAFFIDGVGPEMLVEVKGAVPTIREDMVRVGMGKPDLRYRGQFDVGWYMDMTIRYDSEGIYTLEQIINLLNLGGFACGIGEWRPEKDGQFGMFHVQPDAYGM